MIVKIRPLGETQWVEICILDGLSIGFGRRDTKAYRDIHGQLQYLQGKLTYPDQTLTLVWEVTLNTELTSMLTEGTILEMLVGTTDATKTKYTVNYLLKSVDVPFAKDDIVKTNITMTQTSKVVVQ